MKILMVTPYAPYRDGIAAYAVQEVAGLRRQGHDVVVLSPAPSAAHQHLPLPSVRSMIELLRRTRAHDRTIIQFHPDFFFHPAWPRWQHLLVWTLFVIMGRLSPLELRLHEIDYRVAPRRESPMRLALHGADRISVHTEAERDRCVATFGLDPSAVAVIDHGGAFVPRTTLTREQARDALGVPRDVPVFVSIGFIQPHKGFDRSVRAFSRLDGDARLYVVGDTRTDDAAWLRYCDALEDLVDQTPGAELRRGFVSDERFDMWIRAADTVVLPYREIWSSSVVERAALLGTPSIVTAVGGLREQVGAGGTVVADDRELAEAMAAAAGVGLRASGAGARPPSRDELVARVRAVRAPRVDDEDGRRRFDPARLGPTPRAVPVSANPAFLFVKRVARRLVIWLVEPIASHLDLVVTAADEDMSALERRISRLEADSARRSQPE